jgi:GNAT superfamily N-acetyltransferase
MNNISILNVNRLSVNTMKKLNRLHNKYGTMYPCLLRMRGEHTAWADKPDNNSRVVLYKIDDEVVGWALLSIRRWSGSKHNCFANIQVYVPPRFRRSGIGRTLVERSMKYIKSRRPEVKAINASPPDWNAFWLFASCGLRPTDKYSPSHVEQRLIADKGWK